MKKLITLYSLILVLSGCLEEVTVSEDQYVKVLSLDRSSFAEKILELENGDLLILGEMGRAAFDYESTPQGAEPRSLEDQAPFIAITDPNGNLKTLRLFPIEDFIAQSVDDTIKLFNIENKTTFLSAIQTSDRGLILHAQTVGFDYEIPGTDIIVISEPGNLNYNDFLFKLSEDLKIQKFLSMQGYPGWDFIFRIRGKLRALRDGYVGFILSQRSIPGLATNTPSTGFTFIQYNENLDTVSAMDVFLNQRYIGHDFIQEEDESFTFLGSNDRNFVTRRSLATESAFLASQERIINGDGTSGLNRNEHWIEKMDDGSYILVYTQGRRNIIYERRSAEMSLLNGPVSIGNPSEYAENTVRATRAVEITKNGDVLVYILNIPGESTPLFGELFRLKNNGSILFKQNMDGAPGDVIESRDGSIITLSNPTYNESLQKIRITKMDADGKIY